ncbi:hypothetical protein AQUCO_00100662v1 [Aquilegia coerulea]|uniref:Fe2OG dioxygenase domain-containing protein n=1 Tax=Aquilegia coerulea TaxID=218851 RepID=A0A2G5FBE9_AQUCA|nr:hypothetical protein AQUCO_00100662v1 [Aquilegia coerulea]
MGSESPLRLPIVDFSKTELKPGTPEWESVKLQVKEAVEEYGCFEAVYNKVPTELHKALYSSLEELFDLPLPTKLKNKSTKPFHGYVGQYPNIPLYESMGIDDAINIENAESLASILWPEKGNANFCKTISSFSQQVSELDQIVRRMVLESLGVKKYYDEHIESTNYLLRVMKYKGPKTSDTKLGLNPHTDKNIVTILSQNQVNGLEVQSKNGTWIDVKISPNSFIVMMGDSFLAWTNGRIHSPHHRVMMTGAAARYSTGLFSIPKAGYMVKAPEELVDEEHPLLFKPFDHVEFLSFYYTAEGQSCKSALKTYCGV